MSATEDQTRAVALTSPCPTCGTQPNEDCVNQVTRPSPTLGGSTLIEVPKDRPHYSRYELATSEAKEGSQKLLLSLSQMAPPNSRDPRAYRLAVEDEDGNERLDIELDEHQFCLLMGGHVVKVEGEVTR